MAWVMRHPRQALDDDRPPGQRPEVRAEAVAAWPRAQRPLDRRQLLRPELGPAPHPARRLEPRAPVGVPGVIDRKSTRLNSSHGYISYAVFCLKKKKKTQHARH